MDIHPMTMVNTVLMLTAVRRAKERMFFPVLSALRRAKEGMPLIL